MTSAPSTKMGDLTKRLEALEPTIKKIMGIAGTAGLSIGVMHHDRIIYQGNFGFRDVEQKLPVTEETIFPSCSLTKAMVCAAIGILVEEKRVNWDTYLKDILPDFQPRDYILRNATTVTDVLSHRTGMSIGKYYLGSDNNNLIDIQDSMKFISDQEPINPFRAQFQYNNLGYELAGHIIDKTSGTTWAEMLKRSIFRPLRMDRTFLHDPTEEIDNVATSYNTLDDGTPTRIHMVKATEESFGGASAGVLTCVKDLLKLYKAFLHAANDQFETGKTSTPNSGLKQVNHLFSAKIPMHTSSLHEASYALGWGRIQLPGTMGDIGINPPLMPDGMPVVGKGSSRLVIFHQGSMPGALAAVNLLPESNSAIVVMTNSLALNDCPDWVGQLVLEELLGIADKNDYVQAAEISAAETLKWYPSVSNELREEQTPNTSPRPLTEYVGTYWNAIRVMKIVVTLEDGVLYWAQQGLETEKFALNHDQDDVFTWLQPRNELVKRGRWVDQPKVFWKVRFQSSDANQVDVLSWAHDPELPEGEDYFKDVRRNN